MHGIAEVGEVNPFIKPDVLDQPDFTLPLSPELFVSINVIGSPVGSAEPDVFGGDVPVIIVPAPSHRQIWQDNTTTAESSNVWDSFGSVVVPDVEYNEDDEIPVIAGDLDVVEELFSKFLDGIDDDVVDQSSGLFPFEDVLSHISPEEVESLLSDDPMSDPAAELQRITDHDTQLEEVYPMSVASTSSTDGSFCDDTMSMDSYDKSDSLKIKSSRRGGESRSSPYDTEVSDVVLANGEPKFERKQRKKEQNKSAALRYRMKKRDEQGTIATEYELLEKRNIELKTKVEEITKEISYLKGLMAELSIHPLAA